MLARGQRSAKAALAYKKFSVILLNRIFRHLDRFPPRGRFDPVPTMNI